MRQELIGVAVKWLLKSQLEGAEEDGVQPRGEAMIVPLVACLLMTRVATIVHSVDISCTTDRGTEQAACQSCSGVNVDTF